jgi:hypothetical protein
MARIIFDQLPESTKSIIKTYVDGIDEGEVIVNKLKAMKKILNVAFTEERNQINKTTIESVVSDMVNYGFSIRNLGDLREGEIKQWIDRSCIPFTIVIHFPEVNITNSRKGSHDIKDLYVKFKVRSNGDLMYGMEGVRTEVTEEEYHSRYFHSHLRGFDAGFIGFSPFCLGVGEITQVLSLLGHGFSEENFTLLCIHLKNYIKWESLEGNPHMNLANIGNSGGSSLGTLVPTTLKKIVSMLKSKILSEEDAKEVLKENIKFAVDYNGITCLSTDDFEVSLASIIPSLPPGEVERGGRDNERFLVNKDSTGNYSAVLVNRSRTISFQTTPILKFKGEDKFFKVIRNEAEVKTIKYPHPDITQEFCKQLSRELTKAAIGCKGVKEQKDTLAGQREIAAPDLFPL